MISVTSRAWKWVLGTCTFCPLLSCFGTCLMDAGLWKLRLLIKWTPFSENRDQNKGVGLIDAIQLREEWRIRWENTCPHHMVIYIPNSWYGMVAKLLTPALASYQIVLVIYCTELHKIMVLWIGWAQIGCCRFYLGSFLHWKSPGNWCWRQLKVQLGFCPDGVFIQMSGISVEMFKGSENCSDIFFTQPLHLAVLGFLAAC